MNVYIDLEPFFYYPSGISVYSTHLVRYINKLNPSISFIGTYPTLRKSKIDKIRKCIRDNRLNVNTVHYKYPGRLNPVVEPIWDFLSKNKKENSILHGFNFFIPYGKTYSSKLPYLLTFHDLAGIIHRDKKYWQNRINENEISKQLSNSKAVLTISEFTKKELCKYFNYPLNKVYVTRLAPQDTNNISSVNPAKILSFYGLSNNNYFISVGAISPRKNFDGLLSAFKKFVQVRKSSEKLVLIGKEGWESKNIVDQIKNMHNDVIWIKEISSYFLSILYKNAKAFFLPSHYEGFAIPLLEAMRNKCPVCYGQGSAMDEVCAGTGISVNPKNINEIFDAFSLYSNNKELCEENKEKGFVQSLSFSWEDCALKTLNVYNKILLK